MNAYTTLTHKKLNGFSSVGQVPNIVTEKSKTFINYNILKEMKINTRTYKLQSLNKNFQIEAFSSIKLN